MPRTTAVWLVSVGCMMGVPLMSGFTSKWLLYSAALQAGYAVPALIAWIASIGTVFYCAKATSAVFLGEPTDRTEHAHEAPASMQWGMGLLAAGSVVLSIAPQIPVNYLLSPILAALGMTSPLQVTWFGLTGAAGTWWTTGGLLLALVSVGIGWIVYALAMPPSTVVVSGGALAGGGVFTGGEPLSGPSRLPASDFSSIFQNHWKPFFSGSDVDAVYLGIWRILETVSAAFNRIIAFAETNAVGLMLILVPATVAGLRWLSPATGKAGVSAESIPPVIAGACAIASGALCVAALANAWWRRMAPLMVLSGGCVVAGMLVRQSTLRLTLLEGATLLALLLIWQFSTAAKSRWIYLAVFALSGVLLAGGDEFLEAGDAGWARALLVTGFLLKLAAVPFLFWLVSLADDIPALVLGLIIAVVDIGVFAELYLVAQSAPWILSPSGLWLGIGIASALVGGILMLYQRSLKRLLVLSTVEDVGFLLLGVSSAGRIGMTGALIGAAVHALAKALLFICISTPESDGALDGKSGKSGALASRYPVSAAGFLFGMLAMLGVPPALGFAGRWRLYETAANAGPAVLLAFIVSSAFALIAYVLALTRSWWGPPADPETDGAEPLALRATILVLVAALLTAGLWPNLLAVFIGGVQ
jgi:multicomponent Na+:H+ antiporter subunit D